jgi:RNA polymerase sigma-70 factor, ECF subfamily
MDDRDDLELARACAAAQPDAIAELERRFGPGIDTALRRLRLAPTEIGELRQSLREKLFVGSEGRAPGIGTYEGRGPLAAWLRAVAVRAALSAKRAERRDVDGESKLDAAVSDDDPELAEVRRSYGAAFKQAFQDAFGELAPRERNVIRLVYGNGLAVEQVAALYKVHRVSVSRWLGDARDSLHRTTRALLRDRLGLAEPDLASVARLCLSDIDVSLERLMKDA